MTLAEKKKLLQKDKGNYLYRAMRADGKDVSEPHPVSSQVLSGLDLAEAIFEAVERGSVKTSPFLHFSWNFTEARKWHMRGREDRGEKTGWMARVAVDDLDALVQMPASSQGAPASSQGALEEPYAVLGKRFDLSSQKAAANVFGKKLLDVVSDRCARSLGISINQKEVLVAWRGRLPQGIFEVIDMNSGLAVLYSICIVVQTGRSAAEWRTSCGGKQRKRVRV